MKRKAPKPHANIERARKLPWVTVLCVGERRQGLTERHVENGVRDVLRAAGWWHAPIIAELVGLGRRAEPGTLDILAMEPIESITGMMAAIGVSGFHARTWWIEVKRGDRDVTENQLQQIQLAPKFGARVMVVDEASLLRDYLNNRHARSE